MTRIALSDRAAFAVLVERHLDRLHGYLWQLCGSRTEADDLAQESWLKLWQHASQYDAGKASVRTWLYRIAYNSFIDEQRRSKPATQLDEVFGMQTDAQGPTNATGELANALRRLPETQRTAIALRTMSGFSTRETAVVMGLSERAAESLLARARRSLRQALSKPVDPEQESPHG